MSDHSTVQYIKSLLNLESSTLSNYSAPDTADPECKPTPPHTYVYYDYRDLHIRKRTFQEPQKSSSVATFLENDPSYTNLKPLEILCQEHICARTRRINNQLHKEIQNLLNYHANAYEHARLQRILSYTTMWPLYHTRREIDWMSKDACKIYKFTKKEKKRLNYLMNNKIY